MDTITKRRNTNDRHDTEQNPHHVNQQWFLQHQETPKCT